MWGKPVTKWNWLVERMKNINFLWYFATSWKRTRTSLNCVFKCEKDKDVGLKKLWRVVLAPIKAFWSKEMYDTLTPFAVIIMLYFMYDTLTPIKAFWSKEMYDILTPFAVIIMFYFTHPFNWTLRLLFLFLKIP